MNERIDLICFPYAGAGASAYARWQRELPSHIRIRSVTLPGRGTLFSSPAFTRVEPLVEFLAERVLPETNGPYALFGHSMGALLAFELARKIRRLNRNLPLHLFLSSCRHPVFTGTQPLHSLPRSEFIGKLKKFNGTPVEIFDNEQLVEMLLPLLRSDFEVCETYRYEQQTPLAIPITTCGGAADEGVQPDHLAAWRRESSSEFSLRMFPGDHFYFQSHLTDLCRLIADRLASTTET